MGKGLLLRDLKFGLIIPFVIASFVWNSGASYCLAGQEALGELRVDGQYIEQLVLRRNDGQTEQLNKPEGIIKLAVGEYRIQNVQLKGGFNYSSRNTLKYSWIAVTENEPAILKVGSPLKQTITIERQGPVLVLKYNLSGVGGESYSMVRSKQPSFTVFKDEKKVAADEFEFG